MCWHTVPFDQLAHKLKRGSSHQEVCVIAPAAGEIEHFASWQEAQAPDGFHGVGTDSLRRRANTIVIKQDRLSGHRSSGKG